MNPSHKTFGPGPDEPVSRRAWFNETVYEGLRLFGGSEVSGTRSKARNHTVGGHPESRHLVGLARDLVFDSDSKASDAFSWYYERGLHGYKRPANPLAFHIQDRPAKAPA